GAVHALGHGEDLVHREGAPQHGLEAELERLALGLLRALLELALEVGGLALRGLELRLVLRLALAELGGGGALGGFLEVLPRLVQLPLVLEVLVLRLLLDLEEAAAQGELLGAELLQRAF